MRLEVQDEYCSGEPGEDCTIGAPFFRILKLDQAGLFDESLQFFEDVELWFRILLRHMGYFINEELVIIRKHESNFKRMLDIPLWGDLRSFLRGNYGRHDNRNGRVPVNVSVVVIGRNEGERLRRCLESVVGRTALVVYVDSGSTDGSVAMARSIRSEVVELDTRIPFTAARARNGGFERVRQLAPDLPYVQFVDGDCEVVAGWIGEAVTFLDVQREVALVCGWLRERYPERSLYNMPWDIE